jgi:V/A-type H+-transporting ATPase subunit E
VALEGILEKINRNAEEKVEAIREEGRLKRREIISRAESQARERSERIVVKATEKAELERRRSSVAAELRRRKEILSEKQTLMDECFRAALDELLKLPDEEYRSLIRTMLLRIASSGDETVLVSPDDEKRIAAGFIDRINAELKEAGKNGSLKLERSSPTVRGGFILRTEEVEVDCSFGTLLAQLREDLESDVAAMLFGEGK